MGKLTCGARSTHVRFANGIGEIMVNARIVEEIAICQVEGQFIESGWLDKRLLDRIVDRRAGGGGIVYRLLDKA